MLIKTVLACLQLQVRGDQHAVLENDRHPNDGHQQISSCTSLVGEPEYPEATSATTSILDLCTHLSVSAIFDENNDAQQVENVVAETRETGVADNDDLVTYLEQTGSILALAQRLAEEDEVEEEL